MQYICNILSKLGSITLASDGTAITGLWFKNQKYYGSGLDDSAVHCTSSEIPVFFEAEKWLYRYLDGENIKINLPLLPHGSEFRKKVWRALLNIPYGEIATYGEIAKKLESNTGKHVSPRAVGGAVGHNPISIMIPCHRVIGTSGALTGYAGGIDIKRALLNIEGLIL